MGYDYLSQQNDSLVSENQLQNCEIEKAGWRKLTPILHMMDQFTNSLDNLNLKMKKFNISSKNEDSGDEYSSKTIKNSKLYRILKQKQRLMIHVAEILGKNVQEHCMIAKRIVE